MLFHKKNLTKGEENNEQPIDFPWLIYIGMNKLGFTYKQVMQMHFGLWIDLYETYKKQYNFELKRTAYRIDEVEPVSSLSAL